MNLKPQAVTDAVALELCPFVWCGAPGKLIDELPDRRGNPVEFCAGCEDCDVYTPQCATADEAISLWNALSRTLPPAQAADTSPDQLASPPGGTIRSGEDDAREAVSGNLPVHEAASHPPQAADELAERVKPALALLPITTHDTPDYAEATGGDFQAMTMRPDAFLALNHLPAMFAKLKELEAENARLKALVDVTLPHEEMRAGTMHLRALAAEARAATARNDALEEAAKKAKRIGSIFGKEPPGGERRTNIVWHTATRIAAAILASKEEHR